MITHNLKIAWRNLMKYKMQNLVSAVALAVGMVTITAAMYIASFMREPEYMSLPHYNRWHNVVFEPIDKKLHGGNFPNLHLPFMGEDKLETIEFLGMHSDSDFEYEITFVIDDSIENTMPVRGQFTSSYIFYHSGIRSAIDGKIIPVLNKGDAVISEYQAKKLFGDKNPIGIKIKDYFQEYTIRDVYKQTSLLANSSHLPEYPYIQLCIYGRENVEKVKGFDIQIGRNFLAIMREGYTISQMEEELNAVAAPYGIKCKCITKIEKDNDINHNLKMARNCMLGIGLLMILSTLVGFLKMRIQQLWMRRREATLRSVHGAKKSSLFITFSVEIGITMAMTIMIALMLTAWIISILQSDAIIWLDSMGWSLTGIYPILLIVVVAVTAIIAIVLWANIYKMTHTSDSMTSRLQKGHRHNMRNVMLGTQFAISIIFIGGTLILKQYTDKVLSDYNIPSDDTRFRNALVLEVLSRKEMTYYEQKINELECVKEIIRFKKVNMMFFHKEPNNKSASSYINWAYTTVQSVDTTYFNFMGSPIQWLIPEEQRNYCLVVDETIYHLLENYGMAQKFSLDEHFRLPIPVGGTFKRMPYGRRSKPYNQVVYGLMEKTSENVSHLQSFIVIPKEGKYNELKHALQNIAESRLENKYKFNINNVRDTLVEPDMLIAETMQKAGWMLSLTSVIICIMGIWSSISLDTQTRQKEVAIRKIHGAKPKNIAMLFGRLYIWLLSAACIIAIPLIVIFQKAMDKIMVDKFATENIPLLSNGEPLWENPFAEPVSPIQPITLSVAIITLVTLLIISVHIRKVMKVNPSEIIAKE